MSEKYVDDDDYSEPEEEEEETEVNDPTKPKIQVGKDSDNEGSDSEDDENESNVSDDDDPMSDDEDPENEDARNKRLFSKETEVEPHNYISDEEDDDEDDDDEYEENYLQKFDKTLNENIISEYHPEMQQLNYSEVELLTVIGRSDDGEIYDPLHRTLPFLTKFEKARVLGERAKQINDGAKPFVKLATNAIDGYLIALAELEQKLIPFIIKRPLPNGGCEYWKLKDLELLV
jgi:DNA-directed RNA polymerase I, II, and III subunit RPABC2